MIVYPPQRIHTANPSVFLAGTIDMGNSIDWQQRLGENIPISLCITQDVWTGTILGHSPLITQSLTNKSLGSWTT